MSDSPAPADPGPARQPRAGRPGGESPLPPELRAWMRLLAAAGAVEQRLRARVKESLGVSHDEFLVLCLLADRPGEGLRMTRIAELLGRPKTRLTYQVACLQHAGLVARQTPCGDRRGVQVALTDKGRRLLRETSPELAGAVGCAAAQVIGPEQGKALLALLPEEPPEDTAHDTAQEEAARDDAAQDDAAQDDAARDDTARDDAAREDAARADAARNGTMRESAAQESTARSRPGGAAASAD